MPDDTARATARQRVSATLTRIEALRPLNAVTAILAARALDRADRIDALHHAGQQAGVLAGMPFAAKNIFDVAGLTTRAGSRATENDPPATEDAAVIRRLEDAGAILVALTNMDELAYGFTGENVHDGDTVNPYGGGLSAGGSSSGSAALVAAGAVPFALGTDTNGSSRVPAALSGVVGFKPTFGKLSRAGVYPFVDALDHVGILAADCPTATTVWQAMTGEHAAEGHLSCARLDGYFETPLHPDVVTAVTRAGAILKAERTASFPLAEAARAAAFLMTMGQSGRRHLAGLNAGAQNFGAPCRNRLRAGALLPDDWLAAAYRMQALARDQIDALLSDVDILLAPAAPCPAFPLGSAELTVAGEVLPIRLGIGKFTQCLTLTHVPVAVAAVTGPETGLPVGVQIVAARGREDRLLAALATLDTAGFRITR
ncbi:amidase [Gluconacetobacter sacchari DSM 12717]|nr:amidase [Gluconacetobacter sacchari DSM 12717]